MTIKGPDEEKGWCDGFLDCTTGRCMKRMVAPTDEAESGTGP